MVDRYQRFIASSPGAALARRLGLPRPEILRRYRTGDPPVLGPVRLGGDGALLDPVRTVLVDAGAELVDEQPAALIFDASGIADAAGLRRVYDFFHPAVRTVRSGGRIVVVSRPGDADPDRHLAQRALTGFVRALGKEIGHGVTVTLLRVAPGAEAGIASTLRYLLSARSAYFSGQVVDIDGTDPPPDDWAVPLAGRTALVTGAAQGIGAAIVDTLARDGARVVCLDVPAQGEALSAVANRNAGTAVQLDITAGDAAETLSAHLSERYGGVDVVVHNAGVVRDRTLGRMADTDWDRVVGVNLVAQQAITRRLLADGTLGERPRIVCLSSINGIAGAAGQTNYATTKAGVIGLVEAYAPALAERAGSINAVAPGFIETPMTASMPAVPRAFGRRLSSLAQGGLPVDVAEAVAWLAQPGSAGINGEVVRVCGQNFLGA